MKQPDKKQRFHGMAAIGMGLGLPFGILWENLPLGLLMGASLAGFGNMTNEKVGGRLLKKWIIISIAIRIAIAFAILYFIQAGK